MWPVAPRQISWSGQKVDICPSIRESMNYVVSFDNFSNLSFTLVTLSFLVFQNGDGPLHIAVALGRKRMAKKLIRLGAAGHIRNNVSTPFQFSTHATFTLKLHYLASRTYDYDFVRLNNTTKRPGCRHKLGDRCLLPTIMYLHSNFQPIKKTKT